MGHRSLYSLQFITALAASLALAACGGTADSTGPDGLTGADINAMVTALDSLGAFSFNISQVATQLSAPGLAAQTTGRTVTINRDNACAGGGVIHMTGSYDAYFSGSQGAYSIDVTQRHDACVTSLSNGRQWTFDGKPNVALHVEYIVNSATHVTRMLGWFRGSFTWKSEAGATGQCAADITLSANGIPATSINPGLGVVTGQITGTICTRHVDVHY